MVESNDERIEADGSVEVDRASAIEAAQLALDHEVLDVAPGNVGQLGALVVRCWERGTQPEFALLTRREILTASTRAQDTEPGLDEVVGIVASQIRSLGRHSDQSADRMTTEIARFIRQLEHSGVTTLSEVTTTDAEDFIHGAVLRHRRMSEPAVGTLHLRRNATRLLFQVARQLHIVDFEPTLDLVLPPRSDLHTRPLDDDEELLGRQAARRTLADTRGPAAWALGEATATSSEVGASVVPDVELEHARVWLHGNSRRVPRWGSLTNWGVEALEARIEALGGCPNAGLVYQARSTEKSGQTTSAAAIHDILKAAGLATEPDVRPGSLPAWAGRRVFDPTVENIAEVARILGVRSLDRAAEIIGWNWTTSDTSP